VGVPWLAIRAVFEKIIKGWGIRGCGRTFKGSECEPASEAGRQERESIQGITQVKKQSLFTQAIA
jgi:hypothetical protein